MTYNIVAFILELFVILLAPGLLVAYWWVSVRPQQVSAWLYGPLLLLILAHVVVLTYERFYA